MILDGESKKWYSIPVKLLNSTEKDDFMESKRTEELVTLFERVMNRYLASERKPYRYGERILYRSEIHTVDAIGRNRDINITGLAAEQGVTKGAVSQMIDRLVKKGLVVKTVLSRSDTEVALNLTEDGEKVFAMHQDQHREMFEYMNHTLSDISERDIQIFSDIMNRLNIYLEDQD